MKTRYGSLLAIALALGWWPAATVQGQSAENVLTDRMEQLESETQALRSELAALRQQQQQEPMRLPEVRAMQVDSQGNNAAVPASALMVDPAPAPDMDAIRGEMKKLAWTKGDFKVVPYGSLWADMIYENDRTSPGPYTLWVPSEQVAGEDAFVIDARRTRLGLDVEGPRIPFFRCAKSSARVEIDFMGDTLQDNKGSLLLRHAYWQVKNDDYGFLVGQTWDVVSPLYPGMLNYSPGWCGGNIGFRRAQFRAERYLDFSPEFLLTLQSSLNQNVASDFPSTVGVTREAGSWPTIEGRIAAKLGPRGQGCLPIEFGVSGHIGETGFDLPGLDDYRVKTWSLNTDIQVPITCHLKFQGEFFHGSNLSTFLGGIGQGISPVTYDGVRSTGGWFDFRYDWTDRLHSCFGAGVDDPLNSDLAYGRVYNQFAFANVTFDITKKFITGVETSLWKTHYKGSGALPTQPTEPGEAVVIDWMCQYSF